MWFSTVGAGTVAAGSSRQEAPMQLRHGWWAVVIGAGCGSTSPARPDGSRGPDAAVIDAAPPPALGDVTIELGAEETLFDWTTDRCNDLDLPDVYAHAIRTAAGLVLISGNAPDNYAMFGADFTSLARSCTPVMGS